MAAWPRLAMAFGAPAPVAGTVFDSTRGRINGAGVRDGGDPQS